jgi:type I restriction enzyme M protein
MTHITQSQLESYLWGAATLLRGFIDAGDYKQYIFPLLFFKRMSDVYDEEYALALEESGGDEDYASFAENHRFVIPEEAHWNKVREVGKNVGKAIQDAMRKIESANTDKLYGIFGDAQWTNKDRLPDRTLKEMIEHFSSQTLSIANCPEDELGVGYEYLIKKFADDSGHTAAEFYTNRTVVHLMTELLKPKPGESIYDPTCGSGGMLLSSITHLQSKKKEWRNVRLYGQERNLMTSSIARMNCFLHGVEDFEIVRGDTLSSPKLVEGDRLRQFDVVLANPPYSIKQWDREAFSADPWGRNIYGTPPQGRADYAFWQHIIQSMHPKTGRCAILFPHGVLFRNEEREMRQKLVEHDVIECVLGLGPNLFYNSPMEACVVVCRMNKPRKRKNKILMINAVNEVTRERAQSFLTHDHIQKIIHSFFSEEDVAGFCRLVSLDEIQGHGHSLSIPLYVRAEDESNSKTESPQSIVDQLGKWRVSSRKLRNSMDEFLTEVEEPSVGK